MFIVVMKTSYQQDVKAQVLSLAKESVAEFMKQPGFKSIRIHNAADDGHIMSYIEWEDEKSHLACMNNASWEHLNQQWQALSEAKKTCFEMHSYVIFADARLD